MRMRDGLVAVVSGGVMVLIALADVTQGPGPRPSDASAATTLGALVVAHGALAFRSARPRAAVAVAAVGTAIVAGTGFTASVVALPLALYSLAATGGPAWVTGMAIAGSSTLLAVGHAVGSDGAGDLWLRDTAIAGAAVAVGAWAAAHRQAGRRQAEAEAVRQLAADRLALSRQLHDLAAGTLTAVAVQAGAAAHLGDRRPAAAQQMMRDVAAESRAAMARLRDLAAALRAGEVPMARPAADTVDELVALYRRAGLTVRGSWEPAAGDGERAVLVRLVVQEALTNALRHAGRVDVDLTVVDGDGSTVVEVVNPLPGSPPTAGIPGEGGSGLVGLRERVEQAGGSWEHGVDGDRFRVRAAVPSGGL